MYGALPNIGNSHYGKRTPEKLTPVQNGTVLKQRMISSIAYMYKISTLLMFIYQQ